MPERSWSPAAGAGARGRQGHRKCSQETPWRAPQQRARSAVIPSPLAGKGGGSYQPPYCHLARSGPPTPSHMGKRGRLRRERLWERFPGPAHWCRGPPSWTAFRTVNRDIHRLAAVDCKALDARSSRIAQANRIGPLDECALLAAVDECEPARSIEQKICRAGTHAVVGVGAGKENKAGLVKTGRHGDGIGATRAAHIIGKTHRGK